MPSKQMDNEIDNIILGIVHQAGLIPRGKTVSAAMFPEARAAIERMVGEKIDKALDAADDWLNGALYAGLGRGETIKRLTTPTEDKQND
jgi:hypothetical protein